MRAHAPERSPGSSTGGGHQSMARVIIATAIAISQSRPATCIAAVRPFVGRRRRAVSPAADIALDSDSDSAIWPARLCLFHVDWPLLADWMGRPSRHLRRRGCCTTAWEQISALREIRGDGCERRQPGRREQRGSDEAARAAGAARAARAAGAARAARAARSEGSEGSESGENSGWS